MKKIRINTNICLQLKTSKKQMRCIEAPISVILVEKILKDFGEKIKKNDYLIHVKTSMDGGKLYVIDKEEFNEKLFRIR